MSNTNEKRFPVGKGISTRRHVARTRRHARLRKNVRGTSEAPHLVVHRSSRHVTAQVIDDSIGCTLAAASTLDANLRGFEGDKKVKSAKVGELIVARTKDAGIEKVVFDRGSCQYHGRVAALAEAVREGGPKFQCALTSPTEGMRDVGTQ